MKVVILAGGYGTRIRDLADRLVRLPLWVGVEDDIDNVISTAESALQTY